MSFSFRVFGLVLLVAVIAIGVTAWLSIKLTTQQILDSQQTATRNEVTTVETFRTYALRHGTWAGIDKVVQRISTANGQRVRLTNLYGQVTVDSDHLAKRAARPVLGPPALIDPRPTLSSRRTRSPRRCRRTSRRSSATGWRRRAAEHHRVPADRAVRPLPHRPVRAATDGHHQ